VKVEGVVLAAGASSRMGYSKALLMLVGRSFLDRVLEGMRGGGVSRCTVVVADSADEVAGSAKALGADVVVNPEPELGQISSLRVGVRALRAGCPGAVVTLVDHPLVKPSTYHAVAAELGRDPDALVVPVFGRKRGHPLGLGRKWFDELLRVPEDRGARWLLYQHSEDVVELQVDDPGVLLDLDTPEDVQKVWQRMADLQRGRRA
jgi:molybdenum cofactor cytidylyltransferase